MKKQVDLFSESLVPRQLRINFLLVCGVCGVVAGLMVIASIISGMVVKSAEQDVAVAAANKKRLDQQYQNLMAAKAARKVSPELLTDLEHAQREAKVKQQLLRLVGQSEQNRQQPYSQLMTDLASVDESRVWLEQISISGQQLALLGMASDAEAIPLWIQQVGKQGYLQNKSFNQLVISEQEQLHSFSLRTEPSEDKPQGKAPIAKASKGEVTKP